MTRKAEYQGIYDRIRKILRSDPGITTSAISARLGISGAVVRRIAKEIGVDVASYDFPTFDAVQDSYVKRREEGRS